MDNSLLAVRGINHKYIVVGGYILSKGDYGVRIGTSSRDTKPVCKIRLEQTALTEQVLVELPLTKLWRKRRG